MNIQLQYGRALGYHHSFPLNVPSLNYQLAVEGLPAVEGSRFINSYQYLKLISLESLRPTNSQLPNRRSRGYFATWQMPAGDPRRQD